MRKEFSCTNLSGSEMVSSWEKNAAKEVGTDVLHCSMEAHDLICMRILLKANVIKCYFGFNCRPMCSVTATYHLYIPFGPCSSLWCLFCSHSFCLITLATTLLKPPTLTASSKVYRSCALARMLSPSFLLASFPDSLPSKFLMFPEISSVRLLPSGADWVL